MADMTRPGCGACWPQAAAQVFAAFKTWAPVGDIIDEAHYRIVTKACPVCRQAFVYAMTELIDRADGEDSICRQVAPITQDEATAICRLDTAAAEDLVFRLGGDSRPCIVLDWPKGEDAAYFRATGPRRLAHD